MNNGLRLTAYGLRGPLQRRVEPEWLDALPADDPRAVRSRRDLRLVNRIMGHAGIIRGALHGRLRNDSPRIAELGAGDGTLLLRALPRFEGGNIVFVDRDPVVSRETQAAYAARGCSVAVEQADVFDWLAAQTVVYDAIVANLFLHHFERPALARLLSAAAARTTFFVACEPRRARMPLYGSRLLGLIGCNDVTRHDARLSVHAGFAGLEISALWPAQSAWMLEERRAGLFSHLFVARTVHPSPFAAA